MTDLEDREGSGTAIDALNAENNGGRSGEIEYQLDSKSKRETRDHERETSRSKDKEIEKGFDKDREKDSEVSGRSKDRYGEKIKERSREKDWDRDRERHHRSSRLRYHSRERSERRERGSRDDDDFHRSGDHGRHHRSSRLRYHSTEHGERREHGSRDDDDYRRSRDCDYDRRRDDRGGRRSLRYPSCPKDRSERRSRSLSPSKSKRVSGFDMAPPASAMLAAGAAGAAVTGQVPPAAPTRQTRRVYVGGLSPTANQHCVATFFNQAMAAVGGNTAGPGDAVVHVYINHERKFAFVEMRSVKEASNAMSLDGIIFEGAPLNVRRPNGYNQSLAATLGSSQPSPNLNLAAVGLTCGGPDLIFVGGLPIYYTEAQVRELLESFGTLKAFDLVKDRHTGNSKGYAFCMYQDLSVTDSACAALNGFVLGDKTLTVRHANQGDNR